MNFFESLKITGHLQIAKWYPDGREEIVFDNHNIIVSGFGVGLSYLMTLSGSNNIVDYQLDRFQVGVSSYDTEVSTIYQLSSPLATVAQYGSPNTNVLLVSATQIINGLNSANKVFGLIPFKNVTRINSTSVRYTIVLDEETANNLTLREIGLFMKNPRGDIPSASILCAYRKFSPIAKTSDFALAFKWTISF